MTAAATPTTASATIHKTAQSAPTRPTAPLVMEDTAVSRTRAGESARSDFVTHKRSEKRRLRKKDSDGAWLTFEPR